MDTDVIGQKLVSLQRCIQRVREKTPASADALEADFDLQDIIVLNLQRAVQISIDIATHILAESDAVPTTMAEAFIMLHQQQVLSKEVAKNMARSVGLRNVAVHEYTNLDWNAVYAVARTHLEDFTAFGKEVRGWMERGKDL
ncbi:type II toxin-antitoxin system toxin [Desulfobaculum senezii]